MSDTPSPLRRLFSETAPLYWGRYTLALVFMAVVAVTTALLAWVMRDLINGLFSNKDMRMSLLFAGGVFGIFLLRGIAGYAATTLLASIGNAVVAGLQRRMVASLLSQSLGFFQARTSADLVQKLTLQAMAAREVLQVIVLTLGRDLLTLLALLGVMVISDWKMLIAAVVIMPAAVKGVDLLKKKVRDLTGNEMETLAQMTGQMQELSQGIRIVKAFALEGAMAARMDAAISAVQARADVIARLAARSSPILETVGGFAIGGAIVYGSYRVIALGESPGGFFAFIAAMFLAYEPARRLARLSVDMEKGLAALAALYEVIDATPDFTEGAAELRVSAGTLAFENVTFAYGDATVCQDLSFLAEGGKVTALVGPSGGGKSTLMALAQRFYDPQAGRVTLDGQDIKAVTNASLRAAITFVSQETFLFQGTVFDNIAMGREGAGRDEVIAAAKAAFAHEFIEGLPQGYDTRIGEFGAGLSGGQKQRVALARAFLKDAPVMLLDEATSALDAESERMVQQALDGLIQGRTALVIAHRLSTVMRADRILVIENGRVVESGTHADLVASGGRYARDVAIQFGHEGA